MTLTWLDWGFVAILAVCVLTGLVRGLIREGLGLVVWLIALMAARAFCVQVGEIFHDDISNPVIRVVVGFVLVTLAVILVGGFCIRMLNALISWAGMGSFNRLLGGVFGAAKGLIVVAVIGVVIPATPLEQLPAWQQSVFRPNVVTLQGVLYQQYQRLRDTEDHGQSIVPEATQHSGEANDSDREGALSSSKSQQPNTQQLNTQQQTVQ